MAELDGSRMAGATTTSGGLRRCRLRCADKLRHVADAVRGEVLAQSVDDLGGGPRVDEVGRTNLDGGRAGHQVFQRVVDEVTPPIPTIIEDRGGHRGHEHRGADQCAGLAFMHVLDLPRLEPAAGRGEVECLAARHARRSARAREQADHLDARRIGDARHRLVREQVEGEHLQRVAGEDRRRLVERPVRRRPAATQVVVVHRGQVVVDERIGVDQLDGGGRRVERCRATPIALPAA